MPDNTSMKILVYQRDDPAVFYAPLQDFYQFALADIVEKFLQVHVYDVDIALICIGLALFQRIVGAPFGTEPETAI